MLVAHGGVFVLRGGEAGGWRVVLLLLPLLVVDRYTDSGCCGGWQLCCGGGGDATSCLLPEENWRIPRSSTSLAPHNHILHDEHRLLGDGDGGSCSKLPMRNDAGGRFAGKGTRNVWGILGDLRGFGLEDLRGFRGKFRGYNHSYDKSVQTMVTCQAVMPKSSLLIYIIYKLHVIADVIFPSVDRDSATNLAPPMSASSSGTTAALRAVV